MDAVSSSQWPSGYLCKSLKSALKRVWSLFTSRVEKKKGWVVSESFEIGLK